jgi:LacI family transcriptional regulator
MGRGRNPTIVDVANSAGVSVAAVSKVLRDAKGVSPRMREVVTRAIEELDYRPMVGARSMRGASYTLGFVAPGVFSPFHSEIYAGVTDELPGTPYRTIVALHPCVTEDDDRQAIQDLLARQVDGIILIEPMVPRAWLEEIARRTPVVVVARHDRSDVYDSVMGDDELGTQLVMRHLFELGHRDIVHIANRGAGDAEPDTPHGDWIRRQTYERMMVEAGLAEHVKVVESRFDDHSAYHSMRELLSSGHRPTAVFAGADDAAFGVLRALAEPPTGAAPIAVVGYDNTRFADHPNMSLTSVDQHGHELGRRAAALVLDRITTDRPAVQEVLQPRLIVRRTSVRHGGVPLVPHA